MYKLHALDYGLYALNSGSDALRCLLDALNSDLNALIHFFRVPAKVVSFKNRFDIWGRAPRWAPEMYVGKVGQ